jgi:hypothetical protein
MGVNGRQKQHSVDSVDKSKILMRDNNHAGLLHIIEFYGFAKNAPAGSPEPKVAGSNPARRTIQPFDFLYVASVVLDCHFRFFDPLGVGWG